MLKLTIPKVGLAVGGLVTSFLDYSVLTRAVLVLSLIAYFMNDATDQIRWFWLAGSYITALGKLNDLISFLGISTCALLLVRVHRKEHLGDHKFEQYIPSIVALLIMAGVYGFGGLEAIMQSDGSYAKHFYGGSAVCAVVVRFVLLLFTICPVIQAVKTGVKGEKEGVWRFTAGMMLPFSLSALFALITMPSTNAAWKSIGMGLIRYTFSIAMCSTVFLTGCIQ